MISDESFWMSTTVEKTHTHTWTNISRQQKDEHENKKKIVSNEWQNTKYEQILNKQSKEQKTHRIVLGLQ